MEWGPEDSTIAALMRRRRLDEDSKKLSMLHVTDLMDKKRAMRNMYFKINRRCTHVATFPTAKHYLAVMRRTVRRFAAVTLSVLLAAGCATTTLTPTIRAGDTLAKPDRLLVYDFAVSANELEAKYGLDPQASGGVGSEAQTAEDIQVGKIFAKALSDSLLEELRSRGIDAFRGSDAAPPKENTVSIRGRFLRISQRDGSTLVGFGLKGGRVRIDVQFYQGTGLTLSLVAKGEVDTRINLKPGMTTMLTAATGAGGSGAVANQAVTETIQSDAKRTAQAVAERVTNYYREREWITP